MWGVDRQVLGSRLAAFAATGSSVMGAKSSPVAGMVWASIAAMMFAGLGAFAKYSAMHGIHPFETAFFRSVFCVVLMFPLWARRGPSFAMTRQLKLYGLRVVLSFISMTCWFYALSQMPFASLTAIGFLSPLFGTLAAMLMLGEVVRGRRWSALAVGFVGAIITLHPGQAAFGLGAAVALVATVINGFIGPMVKQLTQVDDPDKIVFISNALLTPLALILAVPVWTWPPLNMLPVLICMGLCAVLGHMSLVRALQKADASLVFALDFVRLPISVAIAWAVFGEVTDAWTYVGALIIFASAAYIVKRESDLKKTGQIVRAVHYRDPLSLTPLRLMD